MKVRLAILQTGEAPPPVYDRHGGFVTMFERSFDLATLEVEATPVDVRAKGEADPLIDTTGFDGLVMTGSAAMVGADDPWMRWSVRQVRALLEAEQPFLGVCFGHQILGLAVEADVGPNPRGREMGVVDVRQREHQDELLTRLPARFLAQVSHADVIRDDRGRLKVLADSPHDPFHVVRAGPAAWGVQYHPEFTAGISRDYLEARRAVLDGERGEGATEERLGRLAETPAACSTLARFAELVAERKKAEARHA